jgi:hypothetical protein
MPKKVRAKATKRTTIIKTPPLISSIDRAHEKIDSLHTKLIKQYKQSLATAQKQLKQHTAALKKLKERLKSAKTNAQKNQIKLRITRLSNEKLTTAEIIHALKRRNVAFRKLQTAVNTFQSIYKKAKKEKIHKKLTTPKKTTRTKTVKKTTKTAKPKHRRHRKEKSILAQRLSTAILKINAIDKS